MKTVKEWFESIKDEDIRRRALANCDASELEDEEPSLHEALLVGFLWGKTPEGVAYWSEQHEKAKRNEL